MSGFIVSLALYEPLKIPDLFWSGRVVIKVRTILTLARASAKALATLYAL